MSLGREHGLPNLGNEAAERVARQYSGAERKRIDKHADEIQGRGVHAIGKGRTHHDVFGAGIGKEQHIERRQQGNEWRRPSARQNRSTAVNGASDRLKNASLPAMFEQLDA